MTFSIYEPEIEIGWPSAQTVDEAMLKSGIERFFQCRRLRSMRRKPIMRKAYRSEPAHLVRTGWIYAATGLERVLRTFRLREPSWAVPDLADLSKAHLIVKCVAGQNYFAPAVAARPNAKIIHLVRHPCGQVHSHLRGVSANKMGALYLPARDQLRGLIESEKPIETLTEADFRQIEILALRWSVYNSAVLHAARNGADVRIQRYEDLCADPTGVAKSIFEWAGIEFDPAVEAFLSEIEGFHGDGDSYHSIRRNPLVAAHKWRTDMADEDIKTVKAICRRSTAATLYEDLV